MGLLDTIKSIPGGLVKGAQQFTGFGGAGKINPETTDPEAYANLYDQALKGVQGVGESGDMPAIRKALEGSALSYLKDLDNNAAGRKANFMEDQARAFQADTQNLARAKGGTGTLAQVLKPSGAMYDAQARANARGLVDLQGQAVKDLGALQGVQGDLYGQDLQKQNSLADIYGRELASRRGQLNANADSRYNAGTERYNRQASTVNAGLKLASKVGTGAGTGGAGGGGGVG